MKFDIFISPSFVLHTTGLYSANQLHTEASDPKSTLFEGMSYSCAGSTNPNTL